MATLVAWWKLDEGSGATSADSSGNGHTLTLNASFWEHVGKVGPSCLACYAQGGSSVPPTYTAIDLGTSYTIALWLRWLQNAPNDDTIIGGVEGHYGWWFDGAATYHSAGSGNFVQLPNTQYLDQLWHYYTVTRAGATVQFYLDGVAVGAPQTLPTPATALVLAALMANYSGVSGSKFTNGHLDDVRLYSGTMTPSEVAALYASTLPAPAAGGGGDSRVQIGGTF